MEKYNEKINKSTDWGGDASTGGLPVAGNRVQEFIKGSLNTKFGAIYKPEGSSTVFCFADTEDRDKYILTEDTSLILDQFETISKYEVQLDYENLQLKYDIIDGATGNTISFGFKIADSTAGDIYIPTDTKARIEYTFNNSNVVEKFTTEVFIDAEGWTRISQPIDEYLKTGVNNVTVDIKGLTTLASRTIPFTYNLFNLSFTPSFQFAEPQTGNVISIPYIIECMGTKYLEFYIDGKSVNSFESMVITDIRKDDRATLDISTLTDGQHTLQIRAYVLSDGTSKFYTPLHFYTFAKAGDARPSFLMYKEFPNTTGIVTGNGIPKITAAQFEQIMFDWSIYDYSGRNLEVRFEWNGTVVSKGKYTNGSINSFNYRPMDPGKGKLSIYALGEDSSKLFDEEIDIDVDETSTGIKETTSQLLLKLQSNGRRNSDSDRDVWSCIGSDGNEYKAEFSGFSWNSQQGWDENTESLVIANGAVVSFNIQPMVNNWAKQGGTFEIDLETFDIDDDNAVICECANKVEGVQSASFKITATKAEFTTAQGTSINTRYKDNERLKIAFIGNRSSQYDSSESSNLMYIVINGVLERAAMFDASDAMESFAYLSIGDPTGKCKVRLRSIRVYQKALTVDEEFNNYVVDSDDVQSVYSRNDVLKAGSTSEIGFDEVANKIPVMIFTGNMNDLTKNGQDKEWRRFDVEYINRAEPGRNFVSFNCQLKLQGTSSLGYPRKNFKLKTKDKKFTKEFYETSKYQLDPNSVTGNLMLRNKETGAKIDFDDFKTNGTLRNTMCYTFDFEGNPLKKGKYRFRADAHKADKWTLKADFMESSCSHNVAGGRSWNDIFENTELLSNGDASYSNMTYSDDALVSTSEYIDYVRPEGVGIDSFTVHTPHRTQAMKDQKKYVCRTEAQKICIAAGADDIRTAVDGFPMVCFYRTSHTSNDLTFMGQYNFINDKGSYEVFGFEDIEDPNDDTKLIYDSSKVECWEGLKNTNPLSLFKTTEGFFDMNEDGTRRKWQDTYESRYPDPDDYGDTSKRQYDPSNLYALSEWIVSTRHVSGETQYSGTLDIDSSFAEKINGYQYGYTDDSAESYKYASGKGLEDNAENRQKKFETEKWEHFDVWKLAGYYIFLMRYGAVDQFVKNTMLFTDGNGPYDSRTDGKYRKWFFINYDNDCLFGLRNNGQLAFDWTLNRQTTDNASDIIDDGGDESGANAYAMMGHDSTLWNNLEVDDEFMRMVRDLDYSMSKYKLNYDNMVNEFDTKQTEQWCERIYNANEKYKYIDAAKGIGDMAGNPVNNLWMLQGTRRSHRHWWIANRFNLLDAQWLSGDYKNTYVEIKTNCKQGTPIHCVAGMKYYYAWGQQKRIYESNIRKDENEAFDLLFPTDQSQGDPVYIYAFNKLKELDFRDIAPLVYEGSFKFVLGNDRVQNTLRKLVIGNPNSVNNTTQDTTTWGDVLGNLEYLDITNFAGITNVPTESFPNLHVLKASGSKIGSFIPAEGSVYTLVELPESIKTLRLKDINFTGVNGTETGLTASFKYKPTTNLEKMELSNNKELGKEYWNRLVYPWISAINASTQASLLYRSKSLTLGNVNWSFSDLNDVWKMKNFKEKGKSFSISGTIDLRQCGNLSSENIEELKNLFGDNCFNQKTAVCYVITPDSVFIETDVTEMVAGQTNVFKMRVYPDEEAVLNKISELTYSLVKETTKTKQDDNKILEDPISGKHFEVIKNLSTVRKGISLKTTKLSGGSFIGTLTSDEIVTGVDSEMTVLVNMVLIDSQGIDKVSFIKFKILDPTYAKTVTIDGSLSNYKSKEYVYTLLPMTDKNVAPVGTYKVTWNLEGEALENGYVETHGVDESNQLIYKIKMSDSQPEISSILNLHAKVENFDGTSADTSIRILSLNETVIATVESNPILMKYCNKYGWTSDSNAVAMTKEEAEKVTTEDFGNKFENISDNFSFREFAYFTNVTSLNDNAFAKSNITAISLPKTLVSIGTYAFDGCKELAEVSIMNEDGNNDSAFIKSIPNGITEIPEGCFRNCSKLGELSLTENVNMINDFAFGGTAIRRVVPISHERGKTTLKLPSSDLIISSNAFETKEWSRETTDNKVEEFVIPSGTTVQTNVFNGREYSILEVENGSERYIAEENVIYSSNRQALIRYAPKAIYKELYETEKGVISIIAYAFFGVKNLKELIVTTSTNIGVGAFAESSMESVDLSQIQTASISNYAFENSSNLRKIDFDANGNLKSIGHHAFAGCSSLESITIPDSITAFTKDSTIYSYAFSGCSSLEKIEFPDDVVELGAQVIMGCNSLKSVVLPKWFPYNVDNYAESYRRIPIISKCPLLASLTLPVFTAVKENADGEMENVTVAKFDYRMISELPSLTEFLLPKEDDNRQYTAVDGVLYSSDKKTIVRVPYGIKEFRGLAENTLVEHHAFYQNNIENVDFAGEIVEIGLSAFEESTVGTVNVKDGLKTIRDNAFSHAEKLSIINLNEGLLDLGQEIFGNCKSLRKLIIPSTVKELPVNMCYVCNNLEEVIIKGIITDIYRTAFAYCNNLHSITILNADAPNLHAQDMGENGIQGAHPFGYDSYNYVGNSYNGEKMLKVPYHSKGYDFDINYTDISQNTETKEWYISETTIKVTPTDNTNMIFKDSENNIYYKTDWDKASWIKPLLSSDYCNFDISYDSITVDDTANIKIYDSSYQIVTASPIYAKSERDGLKWSDGTAYSAYYDIPSESYIMSFGDMVLDNEIITLYYDSDCTNEIKTINGATAQFNVRKYKTNYIIGDVTRKSLFKSKAKVQTVANTNNDEPITITRSEYETLVSKVNQMNEIIKKLL